MKALKIVGEYYRAWQERAGDMSGVPLADGFRFTGPVASFSDAAGFRAMAAQAGAAVRGFRVRHQFGDGDLVCSIVDWEMDPLPETLTAAEILRVEDGLIVSGELIYDAEDMRRAMAPALELSLGGSAAGAGRRDRSLALEPVTVINTVQIKAGEQAVWAILGDLAATDRWLPGVVSARVDGDLRVCVMADGQEVHERISQYDPDRHGFRFRHLRSGLPVRELSGTFSLRPSHDGGTSVVALATTFVPLEAAMAGQVAAMIEQAFGAALESLRGIVEEGV
ncbi:MAG TPA: SRPBCC family protein [Candidatus Limnocylindrales bacterium]|nr:SRPBCC family protein [Candidatus Limnocylindrales bacterium]